MKIEIKIEGVGDYTEFNSGEKTDVLALMAIVRDDKGNEVEKMIWTKKDVTTSRMKKIDNYKDMK